MPNSLIALSTIKELLLSIKGARIVDEFSNELYTVFEIDYTIVKVPNSGITVQHLQNILESQLDLSWWLIDYLFGQYKIA